MLWALDTRTVSSFVVEPSEDYVSLLRVSFLRSFIGYKCSIRTVQHPLCLFHALESIDLLIDKQELTRNKVLRANGLYDSYAMGVSLRRQFKGKIFGFRKFSEPFSLFRAI